jgi:hypothetical protein
VNVCLTPVSVGYGQTVAASGVLVPLVTLLSSPDFLIQRFASMGLANLATNALNQEKVGPWGEGHHSNL